MKDYLFYHNETLARSRCCDDDAMLRICDLCGQDFYGRSGQDYCKTCHENGEG